MCTWMKLLWVLYLHPQDDEELVTQAVTQRPVPSSEAQAVLVSPPLYVDFELQAGSPPDSQQVRSYFHVNVSVGLLQYSQCCIKTNQSACSGIQKKPVTPFPICVIMLWFWLCTDWRGCSQVCCVRRVNESRVKREWITVRAVVQKHLAHTKCLSLDSF